LYPISETQYFPSITFFYCGIKHGAITLECCENYQKGGLRNRCYIAGANGKLSLSIPLLKGKHQQAPIKAVRIDFTAPWQKTHFRTIKAAYGNAPFFPYYQDLVYACIFQKTPFLYDFNLEIMHKINNQLKLNLDFLSTHTFQNAYATKTINLPPYHQVFDDRNDFITNLSMLDLMMNLGPESKIYLANILDT
jgi:hypothetical protein